jgi:hypothetical protein
MPKSLGESEQPGVPTGYQYPTNEGDDDIEESADLEVPEKG